MCLYASTGGTVLLARSEYIPCSPSRRSPSAPGRHVSAGGTFGHPQPWIAIVADSASRHIHPSAPPFQIWPPGDKQRISYLNLERCFYCVIEMILALKLSYQIFKLPTLCKVRFHLKANLYFTISQNGPKRLMSSSDSQPLLTATLNWSIGSSAPQAYGKICTYLNMTL